MTVYKRFRKETDLQFIITGQELQVEITKFITNEKYVPKKWRLLIGLNIINKVDELMDNITAANSIYPKNEELLNMREKYQVMAIANCFQLQNKIVRMEKCIQTVKIEKLTKIIELLNQEVSTLKRWKKSDKIREEKEA